MGTSARISFGLVDVTAKQDTIANAVDKQHFIDLGDLALEGVFAPKVATLEQNYWKLDGTFDTFPDNPEDTSWGYWSESMSDSDGVFDVAPVLTLNFTENHSSLALTFEFDPHGDNYCNDLNIKWYQGETLLMDKDFTPNRWKYSCNEKVENYTKIVITFRSTNRPFRYLKVQNIMHGSIEVFESEQMRNAEIYEEVDLTSVELSINTLDFQVYSANDAFNILNPEGVYSLLQKKQQLTVEGQINATQFNLGVYYVEDWESKENKLFNIKAIDGIGIMDGTIFKGGMYSNKRVDELIEEIMDDAGFGYSLDVLLKDLTISGWIPICSHREALQQVAFAIGGYVDTSRGGTIRIKAQPDLESMTPYNIPISRKFQGTTVKLRPIVTGVMITEHNYNVKATAEEIFKGELTTGLNEVIFNEPATDLTITGGTILSSGVNYAIINVAATGTVVISGKKYVDSTRIVTKKMDSLPAGEKENIISITDATLISANNSIAVGERVFNYYQNRIEQNLSYILDSEIVGGVARIETSPGVFRVAIIESMAIDLTGGFRVKAVVAGV